MGSVAGKVVAITGAGGGLGRGYCAQLAREGAQVAAIDINEDSGEAVVEHVRSNGGIIENFACDVTDQVQVQAAFERIRRAFGPVQVMISNAGGLMAAPAPMEMFSLANWQRAIDVNLTGSWLCAQAVVPGMKAAGYGRIINVSTSMVSQGIPVHAAPYISAKAGVVGLTRALAKELGAFGITVNAIAPGLVPMDRIAPGNPLRSQLQPLVDLVTNQQALKRIGTPDDLCGALLFLASDASAFITGQVINVDGGWALQ